MAEETVKRVTGMNPLFQDMSEISNMSMPSFDGSPSDTSADAAVPVQDNPKQNYYQSASNNPNNMSIHNPRLNTGLPDISSAETVQQSCGSVVVVDKMGRTPSMQRVASLEHLQKRIRGGSQCSAEQ